MTHSEIGALSSEPPIPAHDPHASVLARAAWMLLEEWHVRRSTELLQRLLSFSVASSEAAPDSVGADAFFRQCEQ